MKRIFTAIECSDEIKSIHSELLRQIAERKNEGKISSEQIAEILRPTPLHQLHITLTFIGDTQEDKVSELSNSLGKIKFKKNILEVEKTEIFPSIRKPSVLVMLIKRNDALTELKKSIDDVLCAAGIKIEKRTFKPHFTLGRFKKKLNFETENKMTTLKELQNYCDSLFLGNSFYFSEFILFSSILTQQGPIYNIENIFYSQKK